VWGNGCDGYSDYAYYANCIGVALGDTLLAQYSTDQKNSLDLINAIPAIESLYERVTNPEAVAQRLRDEQKTEAYWQKRSVAQDEALAGLRSYLDRL
jgi:hypothetical protein